MHDPTFSSHHTLFNPFLQPIFELDKRMAGFPKTCDTNIPVPLDLAAPPSQALNDTAQAVSRSQTREIKMDVDHVGSANDVSNASRSENRGSRRRATQEQMQVMDWGV
jgi:hypothetical protein